MEEVSIKVSNLTKVYKLYEKPIDRLKESLGLSKNPKHREYYSLNNVSFEIKKGEIMGIVGSNGAGKSTLLKILTGVLSPTSGEVYTNGTISALLELGTGFNPEFTGRENIYLYGTMHNKSKTEIDNEVDSIIEFAELNGFIDQPVKTYSSGMFARLAFSVAINVNPDILIVDEVLSVGDLKFQIKCMNKMKQMMGGGTTVLFVSHDINAIKRFCTRAIWLNKGQVIDIGDIDLVTDRYLDFLKVGEDNEIITKVEEQKNQEDKLEEFKKNTTMLAEIKRVRILNQDGKEISNFKYNEQILIEVIYDVYDENIENPVLGVALRAIDDEYICGLNTLLDKIKIPWKEGRNTMYLEYNYGVLAIGGEYYIDVALMEETATVPIEYRAKEKSFIVTSGYIGEGKYIIPHKWKGGTK